MKSGDIEQFEKTYGQLQAIHTEISALSKKSPDGTINTFKLNFVNQILAQCNTILQKDKKPLDGFDKFDSDTMPTNSDIVFVVSQYIECLEKFKGDNVRHEKFGGWKWNVVDNSDKEFGTSSPAVRYKH